MYSWKLHVNRSPWKCYRQTGIYEKPQAHYVQTCTMLVQTTCQTVAINVQLYSAWGSLLYLVAHLYLVILLWKKKYKQYGKSGVLKYQTYVHVMAHLNRVPIHHCVQINSRPKVIAASALHTLIPQSPSTKGFCGRDLDLRQKAMYWDKWVSAENDVPVTRQFPL